MGHLLSPSSVLLLFSVLMEGTGDGAESVSDGCLDVVSFAKDEGVDAVDWLDPMLDNASFAL